MSAELKKNSTKQIYNNNSRVYFLNQINLISVYVHASVYVQAGVHVLTHLCLHACVYVSAFVYVHAFLQLKQLHTGLRCTFFTLSHSVKYSTFAQCALIKTLIRGHRILEVKRSLNMYWGIIVNIICHMIYTIMPQNICIALLISKILCPFMNIN